MKKTLLFGVSALGLIGLAGAGVGLNSQNVVETNAFSATTTRLIVKVFDGYDSANANVCLSYANSDKSVEGLMRATESLGYHCYAFDIPEDVYQIQVFRAKNSTVDGYDSTNDGANWANGYNYTGYFNFSADKNFVKVTDWNNAYENYGMYRTTISSGEKVYETIDNKDYDWFGLSSTTSFYFWDDITGQTKILSATRLFNSTTVTATMDEDFVCSGFKAIRVANGASFDGSDWSNSVVWNQGNDVRFTSENATNRAVISRTRTGEWNAGDGFETVSASYFAKAFSYYFLEKTANYCTSALSEDAKTDLASAFDGFEALQTGVKSTFYGKTPSHTAEGWRSEDARTDATTEALSRYWDMVNNRGVSDFLGIKNEISGAKSSIANQSYNDGMGLLIGAISIGALLSIGGLFLLRKRKAE